MYYISVLIVSILCLVILLKYIKVMASNKNVKLIDILRIAAIILLFILFRSIMKDFYLGA